MYELDAKYDVVAPDVPVVPGALFDEAFVREHSAAMQECYDLLADERSREVFLDTVRFKLSGRLEYLRRSESGKDGGVRKYPETDGKRALFRPRRV